jgi:rod shape determining protein RodA
MRKNFDYPLFIATLAITLFGLVLLYSTAHRTGSNIWLRQIIWFGVGLLGMGAAIVFDYQTLGRWAKVIYGVSILLLLGVLWFGSTVRHARSWFTLGPISFQPSEFAKLTTLLMLASYLHDKDKRINDPFSLLISLGIVGLPIFLILRQPDTGTALTFLPILLIMLYIAGTRPLYIVCLVVIGGISFLLPLLRTLVDFRFEDPSHPIFSILKVGKDVGYTVGVLIVLGFFTLLVYRLVKWIGVKMPHRYLWGAYATIFCGVGSSVLIDRFLAEYQRKRLLVFISPDIDPLGAGYNIIQSKIAIGSGGILGKGFLGGTQSQLGFLPERHTDFIFSVIGEEWGFVGVVILLLLYAIIVSQGIHIADGSRDIFGTLLATGITGLIGFQAIVNIGMATGIMPVVGLPLPLVSYGGSSLVMTMTSLGILLNIKLRRFLA